MEAVSPAPIEKGDSANAEFPPHRNHGHEMDCNPVRILVSCTGGVAPACVAMISPGLSFG